MNDTQARARVWTLCLDALVLAALTGPLAGLLTPLAHASSAALPILAAALAAALAVLLIVAVSRVVRPRFDGRRWPSWPLVALAPSQASVRAARYSISQRRVSNE